jgi:hypothetical protein
VSKGVLEVLVWVMPEPGTEGFLPIDVALGRFAKQCGFSWASAPDALRQAAFVETKGEFIAGA